ncbi:MAG: lipopolysaccharide biosynthesis protein [Deltaproteobacteria bacterium]|nr:MAG: lipopolysaccharide biosynthesis protein [Deltaproteobacteria bacterium]
MTEDKPGSAGLRLFREGGLYTAGMFVMRAGNFLLLPLYTAVLTAEEYGGYSIVSRTIAVLVPLAVLGQTHSLLRLSVDAKDRYRLLETAVAWVAGWSLVVTAGAAFAWPWLDEWIGLPLWPLGVAGLLMVTTRALFNLSLTWLQSEHRAAEHTRLSIARWGFLLVGVLVFVVGLELGAVGILLAMGLSFASVAALGLRATLGRRRPALHRPELGESLRYGVAFVPHMVATVVLVATDQVLLAANDAHGLGTAGIYALGANLASAVFMLAAGMQTAWAPLFLKADRDRETRGWGQVRRLSFFSVSVVACGAVGVGLLAPEFVWLAGLFSGTDWSLAAGVVPVLALGALARSYYTVALTVLTANKAFAKWVAAVSIPAALLNGWLNALWIPEHGMAGAAWATSCSWAITALITAVVARFARPVPFKYVRAVVLFAMVFAVLQAGAGASLPSRIGLGLAFAGGLLVLDYRDLVYSVRAVVAKRFG